jgi:deoxyhypusine synthase
LLFQEKHYFITMTDAPKGASAAVLQPSEPVPDNAVSVQGPNFDNSFSLQQFLASYERVGFQATSLGKAIDIVNRMVGLVELTSILFLL